MLNVTLSDMQNKPVVWNLLWLLCIDRQGHITHFLKELANFLSDLLFNVDKALIVRDFNIHLDNTNDVRTCVY